MFLKLLVFQKYRQDNNRQVSIVAQYIFMTHRIYQKGVIFFLSHIELFYGLSGLPVRLSSLGYRLHGRLPEYRC